VSKKTDLITRLIDEVELRYPLPDAPLAGASLLEQGAVVVLLRHMTQKQAEASVVALRTAFKDWNEVRVSQLQEIAQHLRTSSRKKGTELLRDLAPAAAALRDYLQDVYQETHGLDLEFLREDVSAGGKTVAELSSLGMACASYLLWLAGDGSVPVHTGLVRLLDRLGLAPRTASMKKAKETVDPLVPKGRELQFTLAFHEIADRWNDPAQPIYMTVPALLATAAGKKAHQERQASEKREAERKKKEEARRQVAEKKEAERKRREDERAAKRAEAEAARKAREAERRRAAEEREKEKERKRREAEKAKAAAQKKAAAEKAKKAAKKAAPKSSKSARPSSKKPGKSGSRSGASKKTGGSRKGSTKSGGPKAPKAQKSKKTASRTARSR